MRIQSEFEEKDTKEKSSFIFSNKKGKTPFIDYFNFFKKGIEVSINDFELIKVIGRGAFGKVII